MHFISNTAFATWYDLYSSVPDVPVLNEFESFERILVDGNSRDTNRVVSCFLDNPFWGMCLTYTFCHYSDQFFVECAHHFFKQTPPQAKFDPAKDKIFAIVGLKADNHKVVEFYPALARTTTNVDLVMDTPPMRDFMGLGSGTMTFDEIKIEEGLKDADACAFPRMIGGAIPPFLIPCFLSDDPEDIIIAVTKAIHEFAENLDQGDRAVLWKQTFPILKRLWMVAQVINHDWTKGFYKRDCMVPTTDKWAIEKGASIVKMYLTGQQYLGHTHGSAAPPVADSPLTLV